MLRELKEFRLRIIGFLQQILKEELSFHSINDPTLLKRKENANDCMTITWQEPNKTTWTPRSQHIRQRKGQQFEGHEGYDYAVDPKTGSRFYRQSLGNLQTFALGLRANLQAPCRKQLKTSSTISRRIAST